MHPLRRLHETGPGTIAQNRALLAKDVVFHSPVFVRGLEGREAVAAVFAASPAGRPGAYVAEHKLDAQTTFLRWMGMIDGHEIESLEVIVDDEDGKIRDRTLAVRPLPALKLMRDKLYPVLKDLVPEDLWDYPAPP
jgi:hypothetical protein